ncbi:SpoIIE family protein phosphatase [Paraliomyxa miuraensis]|uniref:SpoIIE family protein phosphatase n=1 Tax=Paraliomyxa miuraensis TaxID=376150 RepID=UPI002258707C|nr:SpoIIE family protein phosphatase [Paraliomyxa miuraensis]MCX4245898.1 SpoIIE family protein phosphatase [Paraliomyxa miuraensis]
MVSLPIGVMVANERWRIARVDDTFCELFQCTREGLIGTAFEELFSPRDRRGLHAFDEKISGYTGGLVDLLVVLRPVRADRLVRLRAGREESGWWTIFAEPVLATDADLVHQLEQMHNQLSAAVAAVDEGIAIIDAQHHLVRFNARFFELASFRTTHGVALSEAAVTGKNVFELFDPDAFGPLQRAAIQARTRKRLDESFDLLHDDKHIEAKIRAIHLPVTGFAGCVMTLRDVSARVLLRQKQEEERERLTAELEIAQRIQTAILPAMLDVPGLEIAARMEPFTEVGGDYYDVVPAEGGAWLGIGDVAGHGLIAGLSMLMLQSAVGAAVRCLPDARPSEIITHVNRLLLDNVRHRLGRDDYTTFCLARYRSDGTLVVAGAHEDLVVLRRATGRVELHAPRGTWLGLSDAPPAKEDVTVHLAPGDIILMLTDGATEARDDAGQMLGIERLCELLREHASEPVDVICTALWQAIEAWTCSRADDVTLLVARHG